MKYIKMLGLAAVAAAALTAFVGAGTASAETTLCSVTPAGAETACPAGSGYGVETVISSHLVAGTEAVLSGSGEFLQTKCKKSEVNGKIETATTPSGKLSTLSFEECNHPVKVLQKGSLTIHWDAEHNGNATASGFEVEVQAGITCVFGGTVSSGLTLKGGNPAILEAVNASIPVVGGSFFCPKTATWNAKYEVTAPKPLYVTKGL